MHSTGTPRLFYAAHRRVPGDAREAEMASMGAWRIAVVIETRLCTTASLSFLLHPYAGRPHPPPLLPRPRRLVLYLSNAKELHPARVYCHSVRWY